MGRGRTIPHPPKSPNPAFAATERDENAALPRWTARRLSPRRWLCRSPRAPSVAPSSRLVPSASRRCRSPPARRPTLDGRTPHVLDRSAAQTSRSRISPSEACESRWAPPAGLRGRPRLRSRAAFLSLHDARRCFIIELEPPLHRSRRRLGHDLQVPRDPGAKVPSALLRAVQRRAVVCLTFCKFVIGLLLVVQLHVDGFSSKPTSITA